LSPLVHQPKNAKAGSDNKSNFLRTFFHVLSPKTRAIFMADDANQFADGAIIMIRSSK
jgi:hypothetical protein